MHLLSVHAACASVVDPSLACRVIVTFPLPFFARANASVGCGAPKNAPHRPSKKTKNRGLRQRLRGRINPAPRAAGVHEGRGPAGVGGREGRAGGIAGGGAVCDRGRTAEGESSRVERVFIRSRSMYVVVTPARASRDETTMEPLAHTDPRGAI